MTTPPTGLLFVCMGNICRSPLAEGLFLHLAKERDALTRFRIDSAGTGGWHQGNPPDPRSSEVAARHGVSLISRARQITRADFAPPAPDGGFDWLIAMDHDNAHNMIAAGAPKQRLRLLRSFDPALAHEPANSPNLEVPDPYYGGPEGFDLMYDMIHAATTGLLDHLLTPR